MEDEVDCDVCGAALDPTDEDLSDYCGACDVFFCVEDGCKASHDCEDA